jgi:thiol-disulfide isomerase/thioredoxin
MLLPVLEELAAEYKGRVRIVRLNVDEHPDIAMRYAVNSVPTLSAFREGTERKRLIGAMPKRNIVSELTEFIPPEERDEDPAAYDETIALTLHQGRVRLVRIQPDGTYSFLDSAEQRHGLLYLKTALAARLVRLVAEFEELLNNSYVTREEIRAFLESNPELLLGSDYKSARSRLFLRREGPIPLTPDFVLEPIAGELCDLLEVEPPQHEIATEIDGIHRLSEVVVEACARLRAYRDYFEDDRKRVEIESEHGVKVFRPRLFVVIGRSRRTDPLTRRRLESQFADVTLRTWDEVLTIAKTRISDA